MDETLPVETTQPEIVLINSMENEIMTEHCHMNRDDVARESSLERNALAGTAQAERLGLAGSAQAERLGLENMNKIDADTQSVDETVQRFGFANLDATRVEGAEGRDATEQFGFQNLGAVQRASDVGVSASESSRHASETYGYRNVIATKDAEKEVLEAICASSAGLSATAREILMQNAVNSKDMLLQAASNTAHIRSDMAHGVKDIQLQACRDTDSIKSQGADQFKDVLLQNASNASAVALQNALNAKDAEISRVGNAKDAALAAAVNFERLYGQADRNTAALQASLAECCCEQKELIIERTGRTEGLIRQLDEDRVREELRFAREELTALRLRASLAPPPVAAVAL